MNRRLLRMLDANFNRTREGLRVCEDVMRFFFDEKGTTDELKKIRHSVTRALKQIPAGAAGLAKARDVRGDVGKQFSPLERSRRNASDLFAANIERVKESIRVLEEGAKLIDRRLSSNFKRIRFKIYALEKNILPKLETLRDRRPRGRRLPKSR